MNKGKEFAEKIANAIQDEWRKLNAEGDEVWLLRALSAQLLEALDGVYPLAIAHAAVYQVTNELPELHPVHAEILAKAKQALALAKGDTYASN